MQIPISKRLRCCVDLIPPGGTVADVGCDHGYLGIYLLRQGLATKVLAADLREKPLATAMENAARFGVSDRMEFRHTDGLRGVWTPYDTVVIAGMGGDAIAGILDACDWVRDPKVTLVLQPQTSGNDLRRYLGDHGFSIIQEQLVQDGGYLYFAMQVRHGGGVPLSPGEQYVSRQLLESGSPLLPDYFTRVLGGLRRAATGLARSSDTERFTYYQTALAEVEEMQCAYEHRTGDL
jgi:tRNA (adenine22-N1)-methyltransferase